MSGGKDRIGFIGLGAMGVGMASNVVSKGYPLGIVANKRREPVERLQGLGAVEYSTPKELAENSDIIILCVTTSEVVQEIVQGKDGLLAGKHQPFLLIDCGTSKPQSTLSLGAQLKDAGCSMMDVPLGRSAAAAESGTLNMMAGGAQADFDRAKPLLETMSENLFHVGELGMGHKLKLINNGYSMSVACLIAECVSVAEKAGVDLQLLFDVMAAGPNRSDFFDWAMAGPLTGDETKLQFSLANGSKDIGYFTDMAKDSGVDLNMPNSARQMLSDVVADGHGEDYIPALIRHWREKA